MEKATVTVSVKKPIEKVWESWNEPEHIIKWCSGHPEWHTPKATNNLKVGEKFSNRMEARDGSQGFDFEGKYTEIELHKLIKYVMDDGRKVEITFENIGDSIKLSETFETEDMNTVEFQRQGWQNILNNFKEYTENL